MFTGPFTDITDAIKLWRKFRYFEKNFRKMSQELYSDHLVKISAGVAKICIFTFDLVIILGIIVYVTTLRSYSIMSLFGVSLALLVITFSWFLWSKVAKFLREFLINNYPNSELQGFDE